MPVHYFNKTTLVFSILWTSAIGSALVLLLKSAHFFNFNKLLSLCRVINILLKVFELYMSFIGSELNFEFVRFLMNHVILRQSCNSNPFIDWTVILCEGAEFNQLELSLFLISFQKFWWYRWAEMFVSSYKPKWNSLIYWLFVLCSFLDVCTTKILQILRIPIFNIFDPQ